MSVGVRKRNEKTHWCGGCPLEDGCQFDCLNEPVRHGATGGERMTDRVMAGKAPIPVEVEAGKTYWWCVCGRSAKQPFCDGSHKGTAFAPVAWTAEESKRAFFCACKRTGKEPLCDGSHKNL